MSQNNVKESTVDFNNLEEDIGLPSSESLNQTVSSQKGGASQSPIMKSAANTSPKISVKGDYDQFARQPRKEKNNKSRDRSPIAGSNKSKPSSEEKQQSPTQNVEAVLERENSPITTKTAKQSKDTPNHSRENDDKEKSKRTSIDEHPSANMPVTTLGGEESNPTLSRLDSMPPRKHARVEHMKQLRNEATENNVQNTSPQQAEQKYKFIGTDVQSSSMPNVHRPNEHAFSPPIASVVDFLDNSEFQDRVAVFNRSILDDILRSGNLDPVSMSRLSAKYMIRYLGIGDDPRSKDVISSMLVRPILPPIKRTRKRQEISENSNFSYELPDHSPKLELNPILNTVPRQSHGENSSKHWKKSSDMTYHFQRGTRLRQGDSKYVYKPRAHHSTAVLGATTNSPREMLELGGEIEDDFDRIVKWKSKVRYCGKPAMYKRTTSPTLGEEALKRKLNRLPTRQTHKLWPEQSDLYSKELDQNEAWRRPPSTMNSKLSPLGPPITLSSNGGGFRARPHRRKSINLPKFQDQSLNVIDTASRHRDISLPPPRIPVKKQKPMWQRM